MASYKIHISDSAQKQIRNLSRKTRSRIIEAISNLAKNPRPLGCRKLRGFADVYRVRIGSYRLLYSVDDGLILVIILKVGHRKHVYR